MKLQLPTLFVSALLLLAGSCVAVVFLPALSSVHIIGYSGKYQGADFVITSMHSGSPADVAGMREGDVVLEQANHSVSHWHRLYTSEMSGYVDARNGLIAGPSVYNTLRGPHQIDYTFGPRRLSGREIITQYGVRIFLIIFVFGLAVYIAASRTREPSGILTCACFCFAVIWFASDQPYWPQFNSPLIRGITIVWSNAVDLIEIFSLQLVMGTLLHIALMFPKRRTIMRANKWLPLPIYAAVLIAPMAVLLFADGDLTRRIAEVYKPRIFVNTVLILLTTGIMVDSYRNSKSPALRERTRWIVVAIGTVAVCHLTLWNIPTLIAGYALIANYNWLLLSVVLLPISLTMSITNHELFGIRGILRGRIKLLQARLNRAKRLVEARDLHIGRMQTEIRQLKETLDEYAVFEKHAPRPLLGGLEKLEHQFPELRDIRRQWLIGVSPLWQGVFEQIVLAGRGMGPTLIVGESGTGKTDVARAVHRMSERKDMAYREVSCAQFEHADPAFALGRLFGIGTGHGLPNVPKEGRRGLLEECDGGTLLLDDFDRLPLNVQDLLLYPLEARPFEPGIGSGAGKLVSVKFIFATNCDPEKLGGEGKFRNDVLARMVTRIDIPPLRHRREDIPVLVDHLVRHLSAEVGHNISVVSPKALNLLSRCTYHRGNVRELKAELQKAIGKASLEDDNVLRAGYLSQKFRFGMPGKEPTPRSGAEAPQATTKMGDSVELGVLRRHKFHIMPAEEELGFSHKSKTLSNHLRGMCLQAMADLDWDLAAAARFLAGADNEQEILKLKSKMERYLKRVEENVANQKAATLFNNLPATYHAALTKTISKVGG